ncbi:hypothetical protein ACHAW5_007467 [Stephanodiscus triporus]|uniref:Uncharacterized protein n=1 Tax=Stephanodiscus triporus TaxID=2934178 RepID=A0ABD3MUU2_9STRA
MYRWVIDGIEEWSMSYCDLIVVNSNFTRGEVQRVFPSLFRSPDFDSTANSDRNGERVKVLYPSIESSLAKQRKISSGMNSNEVEVNYKTLFRESFLGPIVSLNRFEKKEKC